MCADNGKISFSIHEFVRIFFMKNITGLLGVWLILCSTLGGLTYAEIDSYALPIISLEYRRSMVMNQSDIDMAQKDFMQFYDGVNNYEELRSAKLLQIDKEHWISWYFPAYSIVCIPFKLLFQFMKLQQERTFSVTNVFLYMLALNIVRIKLKMPPKEKFFVLLLLIVNPIPLKYINYCSAEVFIFSFVVISLVYFYNRQYYLAGLYACIASLPNPAVMAWGIIIFLCFFMSLYKAKKSKSLFGMFIEYRWKIVLIAICYSICLIPYIFNLYSIGRLTAMTDHATFAGVWQRFLTYVFDINLGIASCYPILLILFIILFVKSIWKAEYHLLPYMIGYLFTLFVISFMYHINSGMMLCSRYLIWSYPLLVFSLVSESEQKNSMKRVEWTIMISTIVTSILLIVYITPERSYTEFNRVSEIVLNQFPFMYNPYPATFYSRNCHVDGGYDYRQHTPVVYVDSRTGEVRKILFQGNGADKEQIKRLIKTDRTGDDWISKKLENVANDNKMHYLNISPNKHRSYKEKNLEELGKLQEKAYINGVVDAVISGNGALGSLACEIELKSNTYYKFKIELSDESIGSKCQEAFIDFYSNEGYDYPEQEKHFQLYDTEKSYVFYLNSGDYELKNKKVYARMILVAEDRIHIKSMQIFEMAEIKE